MAPTDPTVLIHIEVVHPDPDAAAEFMRETLGAVDVEPRTAAYIEGMFPGIRLAHVMVGGVVFQFIKPDNEFLPSWKDQLQTRGASVHNITLAVPDLTDVTEKMIERGGTVLFDAEVDMTPAGFEHPPGIHGNAVDTRDQTGLVFEMVPTSLGWVPGEAP